MPWKQAAGWPRQTEGPAFLTPDVGAQVVFEAEFGVLAGIEGEPIDPAGWVGGVHHECP